MHCECLLYDFHVLKRSIIDAVLKSENIEMCPGVGSVSGLLFILSFFMDGLCLGDLSRGSKIKSG